MASGWMPMERSAATECWVGLVFSSCDGPMYGTRETCTKNTLSAADVLADLAGGFEERLGLDVADGAADFGDDDVGGVLALGGQAHAALDLIGDVRDDLDGVAEVFAAAFLGDDGRSRPGRW